MNDLELALFGCAVVMLWVYAGMETRFKDLKKPLGSVLILALPLVVALNATTGFLTIDAAYNIFPEVAHLSSADMTQFRLGAFRTSELLLGPLVLATQAWIGDAYRLAMFLKAFHWLVGFGLMLWIYHISRRWVLGDRHTYFVLYMLVALLLPTNLLALKVFNYDKLSLLLGTLGAFYLIAAWEDRRSLPAAGGLICLALAAQEKLIAAPLVWVALPVFAALYADRPGRTSPRFAAHGAASLVALGIVLAVNASTLIGVAGLRGSFEGLPAATVLTPLQNAFSPLFRGAHEWGSLSAALGLIAGCWAFTGIAAMGLQRLSRFKSRRLRLEPVSERCFLAGVALALVMLIVAVVWTHTGEIYLGPMRPVSAGHYTPDVSYNDTYWHFDAETVWQHGLQLIAADVAVFASCLPSAFWLALVAWFWLDRRTRSANRQPALWALVLMAGAALAAPFGFALTRLPVGPRYFNLFVFWVSIVVVIRLNSRLTSRRRKVAAVLGVFALMLVEILPFGPLYGVYAPVWLRGSDPTFDGTFAPGRMGPLNRWPGWGEEVMIAGRRIEGDCRPEDCEAVRLYTAYPGIWLDPGRISPRRIAIIGNGDRLTYTANDYFIVNRAAVTQAWVRLPEGVAPYCQVAFGNYIQAYVYRGDALAKAGFRFQPFP